MMTSSVIDAVKNDESNNVVQNNDDKTNVITDQSDKKLDYLVIDAGAIIRGHAFNLPHLTKCICTVDEVIGEIKDSKSRQLLTTLPYEIEILTPSDAAMKAVIEFSKKTGDFAALSLTDLKLIALTYTLESKINGNIDLEKKFKMLRPISAAATNAPKSAITSKSTPQLTHIDNLSHDVTAADGIALEDHIQQNQQQRGVDGVDAEIGSDGSDNEDEEDDDEDIENTLEVTDDFQNNDNQTTESSDGNRNVVSVGTHLINEEDFPSFPSLGTTSANLVTNTLPPKNVSSSWASVAIKTPPQTLPSSTTSSTVSTTITTKNLSDKSAGIVDDVTDSTTGLNAVDNSINANNKTKTIGNSNSATQPIFSASETHAFTNVVASASKPNQPTTSSSSSHILSTGSNTHNPNSNKTNQTMAVEDDGEGWINVSNLAVCRANGTVAMDTSITTVPKSADTDGGWSEPVTSSNNKKNTSNNKGKSKRNSNNNKPAATTDLTNIKVACITTDFSIQNVMLQMGLHLMSIEGMLIQKVKQWILRCIGCYQIHYELSRLFCSKCGGSHLTRVAVSIDKETGKLKLHLKANYQVNLRGTKYSLPKPSAMSSHSSNSNSNSKHNKFKGDLLLREDQLLSGIWKQKYLNAQHDAKMQHDDVFTDLGFHNNSGANATGSGGHGSNGLSNLHHMNDITVGFGKKNPNAMKGRERRGKKKT